MTDTTKEPKMLPDIMQQLVNSQSVVLLASVFVGRRQRLLDKGPPGPTDLESVVGALYGQILLLVGIVETLAAQIKHPVSGEDIDVSYLIETADSVLMDYLLKGSKFETEDKTH